MMTKMQYCTRCDRDVASTKTMILEETYPVKGEPITITDVELMVCDECGLELFDSDLDSISLERAYAVYRARHDLPGPAAIIAARMRLNMTEAEFAKAIGCEEVWVHRYERGCIIPQEQADALKTLERPEVGGNNVQ